MPTPFSAHPLLTRRPWPATAAACALASAPAFADGWHGGAAWASDALYRGISLSDGRPAVLLDLAYRTDTGYSAAAGLTTLPGGAEFSASLGRSWQLDLDSSARLGWTHYAYSGTAGSYRSTRDELYAAAGWRGRFYAALSVAPNAVAYLPASYRWVRAPALDGELTWRERLWGPLAFNAGLGYHDVRRSGATGYRYGSLGLSWNSGGLQAHLQRAASNAAARGQAAPGAAGERWVATLLWGF